MLQHGLKEWAVVCEALARGEQAILLRKGGIAEESGEFRIKHERFWLYPTYVHQRREAIQPQWHGLFDAVESNRPPQGFVRLSHFAEVQGVYHIRKLSTALLLSHLHIWSEATVTERFHYRRFGLYALTVRVYAIPNPHLIPVLPEYEGCKSWVELEKPLSIEGARAVLPDDRMKQLVEQIDRLLNPTAMV